MQSNKFLIITLALCILILAAVSTFFSLRQSGVLGLTTSLPLAQTTTTQPPATTTLPASGSLCSEIHNLYRNYCHPTAGQNSQLLPPETTYESTNLPTGTAKKLAVTGHSRLCGDLFKLTQAFCPVTAVRPVPTTICKYGVNSFSLAQRCGTVTSTGLRYEGWQTANYTCYDGTSGIVKLITCGSESELAAQAKILCEGHGSCALPSTTPIASRYCTGDRDCPETQFCRLSQTTTAPATATPVYRYGVCTPKSPAYPTPTAFVRPTSYIFPTKTPLATPTKAVYPTSISGTRTTCSWCGLGCVVYKPGLICPMIAPPEGKKCVSVEGTCRIISSVNPTIIKEIPPPIR